MARTTTMDMNGESGLKVHTSFDVDVKITRLAHGTDLPLPAYETAGAAGCDLRAAVGQDLILQSGERSLVPTGLAISLPPEFEGQVRARSGLAMRHGIGVLNAPGTIDSDYRGEIKVILVNFGTKTYTISRGDRIAQLVIAPVTRAKLVCVEQLDETVRGEQGFGSTGH